MSNSAIYTINATNMAVNTTAGTFVQVPFGSVQRRFGRQLAMDGGSILCCGSGYFDILSILSFTPTDVGTLNVQVRQDNVVVASASCTGTAGSTSVVPVTGLARNCGKCCNTALTLWIDQPGTMDQASTVVETK